MYGTTDDSNEPRSTLQDNEQAAGEWGNFSNLDNQEIRRVFIRKVYLILMIQLLVTFGIVALLYFTPSIRDYAQSSGGQWLYWTSYIVFIVVYIVLICVRRIARQFPLNMILLGILTLSLGYMLGMIATYYTFQSVLIALGITVFVCLGVTLFSFQTKFDFTKYVGVIFVIALVLIIFGIVCIFTYSHILDTIYAALGALVFSVFLAVDTQLIVGGKRYELSAEDYIFASVMLYVDIVAIFIDLLALLGNRI